MLLSLEMIRGVLGVACMAYKRLIPRHADEVSPLEWCCGCVSRAQYVRGEVVWTNETCCPQHREAPLQTVYPPLGRIR
jgi:hypothetical protein